MLKRSLRPRLRPEDLDTTPAPAAGTAASETTTPSEPSSGKVARTATTSAPLDPDQPILLGTFGADNGRGALLRLTGGEVRKVRVGDDVEGDPVVAIGEDSVVLAHNGYARRLSIPGDNRNS